MTNFSDGDTLKYDYKMIFIKSSMLAFVASLITYLFFLLIGSPLEFFPMIGIYFVLIGVIFYKNSYPSKNYNEIVLSSDGIKWNDLGLVNWNEMEVTKQISLLGSETYILLLKGNNVKSLEFSRITEKSLLSLLNKYCPSGHDLKIIALKYAQKRKIKH